MKKRYQIDKQGAVQKFRSSGKGQRSWAASASFRYLCTVLWTIEQLRAIWCCASPNADSRRTSRILRLDKQNQIALFDVQRRLFRSDRDQPFRAPTSFLIVISSERTIPITSER